MQNEKIALKNEINRLIMLLSSQDSEEIQKSKRIEAEINKRMQAVAEYYQKKEQMILKGVHLNMKSLEKDHNILSYVNLADKNALFEVYSESFLLALELERMRDLYAEKENECNEIIV